MNVLILGLNYAPEPVGIGPYTTGMATWLAAAGHTAPQGSIESCCFIDQKEVDVSFEYSGISPRPTKLGVALEQKNYRGSFSVINCWFETGTSGKGSKEFLRSYVRSTKDINSSDGNPSDVTLGPGGIIVARSLLVSGRRGMSKRTMQLLQGLAYDSGIACEVLFESSR